MTTRASTTIKYYDLATYRADWCLAFLDVEAEGNVSRSDMSIAMALPRIARIFYRLRGNNFKSVAPSPRTLRLWIERLDRGEDLLPAYGGTRPAK